MGADKSDFREIITSKSNYFFQNLKQIIVNCKTYVPENLEVIRLN